VAAVALGQDGFTFMYWVISGVLQGCPLSGLVFVAVIDPLLWRCTALLEDKDLGVVRACADDIAAVVGNIRDLKIIADSFDLGAAACGLNVKVRKCWVVPIGRRFNISLADIYRKWLIDHIPAWATFNIGPNLELLGHIVGPNSHDLSWAKPKDKVKTRARKRTKARLPAIITTLDYNIRAAPCIEYCAQYARPQNLTKLDVQFMNSVIICPPNTLSFPALL
jgi:hypothetical protein